MQVASVLVYIENRGSAPRQASISVLGEGRRIASSLGATLYAFALVEERGNMQPADYRDSLVKVLGLAGADQVVLMSAPSSSHDGPGRWTLQGQAFYTACVQLKPTLVLIAATGTGRDIAARLATRTRAVFLAEPSVEYGPKGQVILSQVLAGGSKVRRVSLEEIGMPAVITLSPSWHLPAQGYDEAEAMYVDPPMQLDPPAESKQGLEYLDSRDDVGAALADARIIVVAGGGVASKESLALVRELAEALGGVLGCTATLSERGLAAPELAVGVGARHVSPELYVVCGASGSRDHLDAVGPHAEIVAINSDPTAAIFRYATYGIVSSIEEALPDLIKELRAKAPAQVLP